jgi:hypothetical protein
MTAARSICVGRFVANAMLLPCVAAKVGPVGRGLSKGEREMATAASCPWKKPSMALARECGRHRFHLCDTPKSRGFWGSPNAASCGGRLFPQPAGAT